MAARASDRRPTLPEEGEVAAGREILLVADLGLRAAAAAADRRSSAGDRRRRQRRSPRAGAARAPAGASSAGAMRARPSAAPVAGRHGRAAVSRQRSVGYRRRCFRRLGRE